MSAWRTFYRNLRQPIRVEHTVPPADIVPGFDASPEVVSDDTAEQQARLRAVTRIVHRALLTESLKTEGSRNRGLYDLALDLRLALQPAPAETPPEPLLRAVAPRFGSFRGYAA